MVFKKVGEELPPVWNITENGECILKAGEYIEGIYKKKKVNVGTNNANMYHIEVDGVLKAVWGSTVLDDKMDYVSEGDLIRITFEGKEKNYHKYTVEKDSAEETTNSTEEQTTQDTE